ncbi:MAG: hypothetical protein KatS3mg077_0793 [Candidatus Binatia bacterium]|nr:MAG: hypothetical protein KatS3mg077_0793 [Candidatus Binatia bacterium]
MDADLEQEYAGKPFVGGLGQVDQGGTMEEKVMNTETRPEEFFPRGALAFFFAMIGFYAVLWLVLYSIMAARA